jgi:septal ring factor EnvC (AmiA/AmiB activator)
MKNQIDWTSWILKKNEQVEQEKLQKAKDLSGDKIDSSMLMSELEEIEHHIKEIRDHLSSSDIAPDWVKSKISQSASSLSDIAHYIMGLKEERK